MHRLFFKAHLIYHLCYLKMFYFGMETKKEFNSRHYMLFLPLFMVFILAHYYLLTNDKK